MSLTLSNDVLAAVTYARLYYYAMSASDVSVPFHISPNLKLAMQASLSTWISIPRFGTEQRRFDLSFLKPVFEVKDAT